MQPPLISILMPFKNTASYLTDCINSILLQTYKNWELIAVDDHSTDNSFQIIQEYAKNDQRIQVHQNNGEGIIAALRLAFSESKGVFISRMDSDDIMHPEKLEILQKNLSIKGKGHLAVGLVQYFSELGVSDGYQKYEQWLNKLTLKGNNYSELYKECVIPSPCWMIYREDLIRCNAFKPDRYPEDYDLTFRFYKKGLQCIPCDQLLHYWRDYPERTSRTHIHYAQNYFLDIKLYYFLELHYHKNRPLVIWGAGYKGKTIARKLVNHKIRFHWICDNPKKIGKKIYGQQMHDFSYLLSLKNPQSIITVANAKAQGEIRSFMRAHDFKSMIDYFFFC